MEAKIVYEDEWLLIVNKAPGILSVPSPQREGRPSLQELLNKKYEKRGIKVFPCHRLDKDTSGLIIFAKDKKIQQKIQDLFRNHQVKKNYIAVVQGWMERDSGQIRTRVYDSSIPDRAKVAITKFRVLKKTLEFSIIEVRPITGRKNQIRLHFRQIGHPIIGERKFVYARDYDLKLNRLALHARGLEFIHPILKKKLKLSSELPPLIQKFFTA